ncbi:CGI-121-domain-containing protein [Serendipita vermifera]|nr:CGI-121-domain-containing protein [Serendipita vermifera]
MEAYQFPHLGTTIYLALFKNVQNAASLKARLVAASTMQGEEGVQERAAVNFAFVDGRLITSRTALETGIHQAVLTARQGALRTKYVHSEILLALNPGNNISEAIRRFGVADSSSSLVVVLVSLDDTPESIDVERSMKSVVQGELSPLDQLPTDWTAIKKYYKLGGDVSLTSAKSEEERRLLIDRAVVNIIAIKPVAG